MNKTDKFKTIDIQNWVRKKQYDFFKEYDDPCFNVTVPVDVTRLLDYCRSSEQSFFLSSLHTVLMAVNNVEALRIRCVDNEVRLYESIDAGCTIFNDDLTFTFCYFDKEDTLEVFNRKGNKKINNVRNTDHFEARDDDLDLIHCSALPWMSFTSFKHARDNKKNQSIPKIIFGKYDESEKKIMMPLSIEVMHSLADGYHVGLFYEEVNKYLAAL